MRISHKRRCFPATVSQHAVWLYVRVTLSLRDVEEMRARRGSGVSCETIRASTLKSGPKIAANPRRRKLPPSPRWYLDEVVCKIGDKRMDLWRAVDDEGEVPDRVVQERRDTRAALKLSKQLLHSQAVKPGRIVTDGLASYGSALRAPGREGGPSSLLPAREQPRRELTSADPKARAKVAWVQVPGFGAAVSDNARCALQRIQFAASHDQSANAPGLSGMGGPCLGEGGRLSGIPHPASDVVLPGQADSPVVAIFAAPQPTFF